MKKLLASFVIVCLLSWEIVPATALSAEQTGSASAAAPAAPAVPAPPAVPEGQTLLQKGAVIKLQLNEALSSQQNRTGDIVHYTVVTDLKVGDVTVVAAGSEALGKVVEARPAKGWGKGGNLQISVETVNAVDGTKVPLIAEMGEGKSWAAGKTILGVAVFGLAFGGAMKGKKVNIPKGLEIEVFIGEDTLINLSKNADADKAGASANICFKFCESKSGDEFKTCMSSCGVCKSTCEDLAGDELGICLAKCSSAN